MALQGKAREGREGEGREGKGGEGREPAADSDKCLMKQPWVFKKN